jgi:hypothetical protein
MCVCACMVAGDDVAHVMAGALNKLPAQLNQSTAQDDPTAFIESISLAVSVLQVGEGGEVRVEREPCRWRARAPLHLHLVAIMPQAGVGLC